MTTRSRFNASHLSGHPAEALTHTSESPIDCTCQSNSKLSMYGRNYLERTSFATGYYLRYICTESRQSRRTTVTGKNRKSTAPNEQHLHLARPATHDSASIADTHTHLQSTFSVYRSKYPGGRYETVFDFVRGICAGRDVDALVDVWCEAPVLKAQWRPLADSAISAEDRKDKWAGIEYWFVMGASFRVHSFVVGQLPDAGICCGNSPS